MRRIAVFLGIIAMGGATFSFERSEAPLRQRAYELAHRYIIADTHIDVPYRLYRRWEAIGERTEEGDFDYPRAKAGGLNVVFMAIYVPSEHEEKGDAKEMADRLIGIVERIVATWPNKFAIAYSIEDIHRHFAEGKISIVMGMENGAPIEGKLENLHYFYKRGIRYITLAHAKSNHIADSSYDEVRRWRGLSPFGRRVVEEMNRLGIIVDVSHISDEAFEDVIQHTSAPVIASHSSCRAFTPGWERNMSDAMIRKLAAIGGVIHINFGSAFISDRFRRQSERMWEAFQAYLKAHNLSPSDPAAQAYLRRYREQHPLPFPSVSDVADHIDHVVRLVGIDHVGLGSDFDGVGDTLPEGLKDVSQYPNLIYELLKRGYTESDIQKILSGNLFRVWRQVERVARSFQTASTRSP